MHALEDHKQICKSESGYGSEVGLRRHPSLGSLASTASPSIASTGSFLVMIFFIRQQKHRTFFLLHL